MRSAVTGFSEHAVGRVGERDRFGVDRLGAVEQPTQRLFDRDERRRHQLPAAR